ncbi:DUF868 family protein (DUF868) [Rhynchospora pubera]|uniref:DUF868 family protein (DUF868) n=1 Tax=Rhynchospora pubera TaxID=906938 RepID=A0AAV8CUR6_9POAL|nr:DUF868 family protein (DUF868) [Rhynchospora pubera]KAJ4810666.1 DUF868 family protein (DUF868) [Rhynchospora pubera]
MMKRLKSRNASRRDDEQSLSIAPNISSANPDIPSDDSVNNTKPAPQCSVVSFYETKMGGVPRQVTISWTKSLISHSFSISVEGRENGPLLCRVELKPWPFRGRKGFREEEVDGDHVKIFWDIRSAKFLEGPEPISSYYIAIVSQDEVVLLVGDSHKSAYKKSKSRPSLEDPILLCKRESALSKRNFTTRAWFNSGRGKEHNIVIENSIPGSKDPEMRISIDGKVLISVKNLHWKFRGSEMVFVEQSPVQVFWDVHDWVFNGPWSQAFFVFKQGNAELLKEYDDNGEMLCDCDNLSGFCFFLNAWRTE